MKGHRFFAAVYDRLMAANEEAGMSDKRADLLAGARGRTLELGAGTGLNLEHYPDSVSELLLTEPDPHMAKRLRGRVELAGRPFAVEVVEAGAEQLPFAEASFDTVVSTLVFCTIPDPDRAAAEVARVLRPEGSLLLLEHVRSEEPRTARWQDRLERPWGWFAAGCHPNRDTSATLSSRFDVSALDDDTCPGTVPPLVKPLLRGAARPAAEARE
jgi:ubiquinone/menaquinone biosynthesis C-methylase UbiE